jgi:DNA-binding beta-propeller fold protein YncE
VADAQGHRVLLVDGEAGLLLAERALPLAPVALALDGSRGLLYVGEAGTGRILALGAEDLVVRGEVTLAGLGIPYDLALDAAGGRLYVVHALSARFGAVSAIDLESFTVVATRTGNYVEPLAGAGAAALVDGGRTLAVSLTGGVASLDAATLELLSVQRGWTSWT